MNNATQQIVNRRTVVGEAGSARRPSLEDAENLPEPEVLAREIADDLQTPLDQINAVLEGLRR